MSEYFKRCIWQTSYRALKKKLRKKSRNRPKVFRKAESFLFGSKKVIGLEHKISTWNFVHIFISRCHLAYCIFL